MFRLVEVLLPFLFKIFVDRAFDGHGVHLYPTALGFERLIKQFISLFLIHFFPPYYCDRFIRHWRCKVRAAKLNREITGGSMKRQVCPVSYYRTPPDGSA